MSLSFFFLGLFRFHTVWEEFSSARLLSAAIMEHVLQVEAVAKFLLEKKYFLTALELLQVGDVLLVFQKKKNTVFPLQSRENKLLSMCALSHIFSRTTLLRFLLPTRQCHLTNFLKFTIIFYIFYDLEMQCFPCICVPAAFSKSILPFRSCVYL
jgi:hypothetical protein